MALVHRPPQLPFCGIVGCVQYCDDDGIALNGEVDGLGETRSSARLVPDLRYW